MTRGILAALAREWGLEAVELRALALGADANSAVYRAVDTAGTAWFVKLRSGAFDEAIARLPGFLRDAGIRAVLAPVPTRAGRPCAAVGERHLLVYPFVLGRRGLEVTLSESQWRALGEALRQLHGISLPQSLATRIPRESWSPRWRERVRGLLAREPRLLPAGLRELVGTRRADFVYLVERAERLAAELAARAPAFVLCHTDVHGGNVLLAESGELWIVDWDAPLLAPKERDLMFFGGGQGWLGVTPEAEERLFQRGYGEVPVDRAALAYYRCERIVEDLALYSAQILDESESRVGREDALRRMAANWLPGGTLERARAS